MTWWPGTQRVLVAVVASSLFVASRASAYTTLADELDLPAPVGWATDSVAFDVGTGVDEDFFLELAPSFAAASESWGSECGAPSLRLEDRQVSAKAGDGRNTIDVVTSGWESRGFEAEQAAVTDVQVLGSEISGYRIVEADIYINAAHFSWSSEGDATGSKSLRAMLVHEVGHILGLSHPMCSGPCGPEYAEVAMWPDYSATLAGPAVDDLEGVCAIYSACSCSGEQLCVGGQCLEPCGGAVCAPGHACVSGVCQDPACPAGGCAERQLGEPCDQDGDCVAGVCLAAGHCGVACREEADCGGAPCRGGNCDLGAAPFASTCSVAEDCLSGLCLVDEPGPAQCTMACDVEIGSSCPASFQCTAVEGQGVCRGVTSASPAPSSCGIGSPSSVPSHPVHPLFLVLPALFALVGRRRAPSSTRSS